jgi:omega-amidase
MQFNLTLAQMDIVFGDPESNYTCAASLVAQAAERGSQLVLLPELWSTGYDLPNWNQHASRLNEGMFARMADLAKHHQIAVGGSLLETLDGRAYNTFVLFDAKGDLVGCYRKVHLFRLMDEHLWLSAGDRLALCQLDLPGLDQPLRLGLAICYDLRFPEIFRRYALEGASLILLPAEWPAVRIQHWNTLVQARAIENQVFLAAANRTGHSPTDIFGGNSLAVGPWGEILAEGGEEEALLTCTIDLERVAEVRRKIPILDDRRPEVYPAPLPELDSRP